MLIITMQSLILTVWYTLMLRDNLQIFEGIYVHNTDGGGEGELSE